MTFEKRLSDYQEKINHALEQMVVLEELAQKEVFEAMRYSLNSGGKRLRPLLTLEFARICGAAEEQAMPFACAVEAIHTYSLIHDDLPCMDDDAMRRGRPTSHRVFGEALAVLAGDALLNKAFEILLETCMNAAGETQGRYVRAAYALARASGAYGMVGGQVLDMEGEERTLDLDEITTLQALKTGAIIRASAEMGCLIAGAEEAELDAARRFADKLGLAFQIQDDILNVEGDEEILGKDVGNDEKSGKSTFVKLFGLTECKKRVNELTKQAIDALGCFQDNAFLIWLTQRLADRNH